MPDTPDSKPPASGPHEQMLRLVARGFYKELVNYGVQEPEILTVAAHLLDNVISKSPPPSRQVEKYNRLFTIGDVEDRWSESQTVALQGISLTPFQASHLDRLAGWLEDPKVRDSFFPRFPGSRSDLERYFQAPDREYFDIWFEGRPVGLMGGENIDPEAAKLEMKKLVGDPGMRGKGIGKRATFLFLYHTFVIRKFNKVYLHTLDINIRNLNLNGNLGFSLEGVFFDDVMIDQARQDLVRMALTEPAWRKLFSQSAEAAEA